MPPELAHGYAAAGISVGSVGSVKVGGIAVDLAFHAKGPLWIHGGLEAASEYTFFGPAAQFSAWHAGAELSSCHRRDPVCAYVGADIGRAHEVDSDIMASHDGTVGIARAGLDVGGAHVRWRPGFVLAFGSVSTGVVTQSLAVQF